MTDNWGLSAPTVDVVVAGAGVSGLLIASALAERCSVVVVEKCDDPPINKYWLTDEAAAEASPTLAGCIDRRYDFLDFIAFDGATARVRGRYCLWDSQRLVAHLIRRLAACGVEILTGHRLYSLTTTRSGVSIRANARIIHARLLVDCMGFGSPIVGAKSVASITGYYVMQGSEVGLREDVDPVGLDNVIIDRRPMFFELFPTSRGTAHAALILPCRDHRPNRPIEGDLGFILSKSHYAGRIVQETPASGRRYFGIIPVGRMRTLALDRIVFFGEAGQANPATSATGLSRMLRTYQALAASLEECLAHDRLTRRDLIRAIPPYMSAMNRAFQESLFESLLSFDSGDFRRLVQELDACPDDVVNDLVFADFSFCSRRAGLLAVRAIAHPQSILGRHVFRSVLKYLH
jgi:flavin-dependent dehydrogenase